jgi:hypothetical protein
MRRRRLPGFLEVFFAKRPQVVDLEGIEGQSNVSVDNFVENLSRRPGSLENQGFGWIAHEKSKLLNLYESMTCDHYGFCSGTGRFGNTLRHRTTNFVHKSPWAANYFSGKPAEKA